MAEKKSDPIQDPEFKRVPKNLLNTPYGPQTELKVGGRAKTARKPKDEKPVKGGGRH